MQKLKHIKYTKLSSILSETVPSLVESPFCHTSSHDVDGDFLLFVGSSESPHSIWFRVTRKLGCTYLVRDSRVRNWLWLGKVLAPLTHPT